MSEELLKLEHISKAFSGVVVLEDISLSIPRGQVISIVGENGAGKSTLANIISGSLKPSSGKLYFEGKICEELSIRQAREYGISMVHQELMVLPELDITANIFIGTEYQKRGVLFQKKMREKAAAILKTLGMSISPDTLVKDIDISGRQMIEIARAISGRASIILLDEPTSSLSDTEIQKLFQVVQSLKQQGISFIFVSHRLKEVLEISDYIYVLKDGRLVTGLEPEKTDEDEIIVQMVGRSFDDFYDRKRTYFGKEALRLENFSGIEDKNLSRNAHIPRNVNLHVEEGEVLGISGLVGAGRTELARLIFGEDRKESGELYLFGEPVKLGCCREAYEKGLAWVTEDRKNEGLILDFDIKRNMVLPIQRRLARGAFVNKQAENAVVEKYIGRLNVKTTGSGQLTRFLSGGNQQKVVLAKWLASEPKVLVLDEPTKGIDVNAKHEIYTLINELTAQGMAIILISSELMEVIGMSDRIMVMHDGRISGEFEREEFTEEAIMACAVGKEKI